MAGTGAACGGSALCGDGGQAVSAELSAPGGVAVDGAGDLFIADTGDNRIREVAAATGDISTIAGSGVACSDPTTPCGEGQSATAALFNAPRGVAVDGAGDVFIADTNDDKVRELDTAGAVSTIAGDGQTSCAVTAGCGDGGLASAAQLDAPSSVAVRPDGSVLVADGLHSRVRVISAPTAGARTIRAFAGTGSQCAPPVYTYVPGGCGDGTAAAGAPLGGLPAQVTVDALGDTFIAVADSDVVREVSPTGVISTVAGDGTPCTAAPSTVGFCGDGGPPSAAQLAAPAGVTVSADGVHVTIAEAADLREVTFPPATTVAPPPVVAPPPASPTVPPTPPAVSLVPTRSVVGSQAVLTAKAEAPPGTSILGYTYDLSTPGRRYTFTCPPNAPVATAGFSGPTVGTATLTAKGSNGGSALASATFTTTSLKSATAPAGSGVMTSHTCAPGTTRVIDSKASFKGVVTGQFCPARTALTTVTSGYIDVEMCSVVQLTTPSLVPGSAGLILARHLRADAAHGIVGDQFFLTYTTARVNGLILKPAPGQPIVIAVGGREGTGFLQANTAFLISPDATFYFVMNADTQTAADLAVRHGSSVPLNWSSVQVRKGLHGAATVVSRPGGTVDLDVGAVAYTDDENSITPPPRAEVTVASFDVGHLAQGLSFPAIPLPGVALTGTLGAQFAIGPGSVPYTKLVDVQLTVPLGLDASNGGVAGTGASITGQVQISTDNQHGPNISKLEVAFTRGNTGWLQEMPLSSLTLAYYGYAGQDTDVNDNPIPGKRHAAQSFVGSAMVSLPPPFGGTLQADLHLARAGGWQAAVAYNGNLPIVPAPTPVYLTHADLTFDSATDSLVGNAHLAVLWSTGDNGCGVVGINGHLAIGFDRDYVHADDNTELLCLPMGATNSFDLYAAKDGSSNGIVVSIGGGIDYDLGGAVRVTGKITGGAYLGTDGSWHVQLDGDESGSADVGPISGSFNGEVVISDAGFGVCADLQSHLDILGVTIDQEVHPGFGFHFADQQDFVTTILSAVSGVGTPYVAANLAAKFLGGEGYLTGDSCNIDQFRSLNGTLAPPSENAGNTAGSRPLSVGAADAAPTGSIAFTLPDHRVTILRLTGQRALPRFVLHGPGGRVVDVSAGSSEAGPGYVVLTSAAKNQTTVYLTGNTKGTWRASASPGSPRITNIALSRQLANPSASGAVAGTGARRTVHYALHNLPTGTTVTLVERGPDGGYVTLGRSHHMTGAMTFTIPTLRTGTDTILAIPQLPGRRTGTALPVATLHTTPAPLSRPVGLRTLRAGGTLTVSFHPVPTATAYVTTVRLSNGQRLSTTSTNRTPRAAFIHLPPKAKLMSVSVQAIRDGQLSQPSTLAATR